MAFQEQNLNTGQEAKEEYLSILEKAQEARKAKVANLSSYERQSDTASLRPIREADVMFKVRLWTRVNFNEKINKSYDSKESKLVELIYEGIEEYFLAGDGSGAVIAPYSALGNSKYPRTNFGITEPLTEEQYREAITNNLVQKEDPTDAEIDAKVSELRLNPEYASTNATALRDIADQQLRAEKQKTQYFEKDGAFNQIIMEEDLVFDKNHSLPVWDIISITVVSPFVGGAEQNLFKVKFADVKRYIDRVYKETNNDRAYWFNPQNPGNRNLSFSDALDKRMFNSYIVSVENVDHKDILETFAANDNYNSLVFAEKIRLQLLERVHNLWEY
jgi:hypothetical protein